MRHGFLRIIAGSVLFLFFLPGVFAEELNRKEEDSFYVAARAFEDGFYDVSLTLFDRFLKTYLQTEKKSEALTYIGRGYFHQEKYLKALDVFERLLKMPEAGDFKDRILFWLGEIYAKGKDYKHAMEFYNELISEFKESSYVLSATSALARVQFESGKFGEAAATYRTLLDQTPDKAAMEEAFFGICRALYHGGEYDRLKEELVVFLADYPDSRWLDRAAFYLGEANYYLQNYPDAVTAYRRAQARSQDAEVIRLSRLGIGWSYLKLKKFKEAQEVFALFEGESQPVAVLLGRAVLLSGLSKFDEALLLFEEVVRRDAGEYAPFAFFGKAEVLYGLLRFAEAITSYGMALDGLASISGVHTAQAKELRDKIHYGRAWSYLKLGDFRRAQEAFQKVASGSSDRIAKLSALCQLGDTYQDAGEFVKAIVTYQDVLYQYPGSVYHDYVQYQLAMTWLKKESLDSAIIGFRILIRDYPSSKLADDARYFLGVCYFQKGEFEAARQQLGSFIADWRDSPYRPQAMFLLGEAHLNLSAYKEALRIFQMVVKEYGDHETLRQKAEYEIASAYHGLGQEAEANKRLSDFITRYPDSQLSGDILFWLGQAYFQKEDYPATRKFFERLIRNYPSHELLGDAYLEIALTYLEEDNADAALRHLRQAAEKGREAVRDKARLLEGDIFLEKKDVKEALRLYEEVVSAGGLYVQSAHMKIAVAYRHQGFYEKALASCREAFARRGTESMAWVQFTMGELLEELNRPEAALEAYSKVFYLYPESERWSVKALLRVARIYEDKGDRRELRRILEKVAAYPVEQARYAREKLKELEDE